MSGFWHKADIPPRSINVRFWGKADIAQTAAMSASDPKRTLSSNPVERETPNLNSDMLRMPCVALGSGKPMRRQELITFLGGVSSR
jgi:hypothetical protein